VRYGWFDAVLARYALQGVGGVDALAVTHLDAVPRRDAWRACSAYVDGTGGERVDHLPAVRGRAAKVHPELTSWIRRAQPIYETYPATEEAAVSTVERLLHLPVKVRIRGPRAIDVSAQFPLVG
jgi:adenylosuccinate synthase